MNSVRFPATLADIDAEWMSGALASRFGDVRVASVRSTTYIDGTAAKVRYELEYADRGAGAPPASLWIKGGFNAKGAHQGEAFANEVRFFTEISPDLPIPVPDCYWGMVDEKTRNGVVLLEDLTARDAKFGNAGSPLSVDEAASVLDVQASYHAHYWKSPKLFSFSWLKNAGAMAEVNMVDQYFSLWDGASKLPRFDYVTGPLRDKELCRRTLLSLVENLRREPICLVHGDTHAANLFFLPKGKVGYLDWQHIMRGSWTFDFANFMGTSLTVEDRRKNERHLLKHYLGRLAAQGADAPNFDDAWLQYRRYAIWPLMWVMCPVEVHPESVCSANAERACTAILDLDTIQSYA